MKKILLVLALALVLAVPATAGDAPQPGASGQVAQAEAPAIVRSLAKVEVTALLKDGRLAPGNGTAFAIGKRRMGTATHVIKVEHPLVEKVVAIIVRINGKVYEVESTRVIYGDLAEITLKKPHGLPVLPIADKAPSGWTHAELAGYPLDGKFWSRSEGVAKVVSVPVQKYPDAPKWLRTRAAFIPGMSGGPVLVGGKVVAVISRANGRDWWLCALADRASVRAARAAADAARAAAEKAAGDAQDPPKKKALTGAPGASGG